MIRDRFVAVFALGPIAAGCLGRVRTPAIAPALAPAIAPAIALAIALASLLTGPCALAQSVTQVRIAPPISRKARPAPPRPRPGSPA